jgi:hypothetical protein
VTKRRGRLHSGGTSESRPHSCWGVDFRAFGARGFIGVGGRVVAELIAQILILSYFSSKTDHLS